MLLARRPSGRSLALALCLLLVVGVLLVQLAERARGDGTNRCERFTADSAERAEIVTGAGRDVVVIGDSWSAGLGLDEIGTSWPSRLAGRVRVAGFSGSGFSAGASACGPSVSFAERAAGALRGPVDLVVVEGGLNDVDQPDAAIRAGFERLMDRVEARAGGAPVVVVGPATAPSRAARVPRVDQLLAGLAEQHAATYVPTSGLDLAYLDDRLHLTPEGHRAFGDAVAAAIAAAGV
ncbi:SGNH/GDSL hydrolase family protein [Nocardioides sp. SOB77]|uniref:SGNH/GDSL hydrolase family protein n=1 Tax=Nocardioides oceani TaxID=3058369 RepID=A0ABT8FA40_9ACTN|nr:SGNH/GDSL hydrolase family protein [Nocardioides oceani]MDN4171556.1 SGNH/GDSL hydrolase family protein [Nocardioides oceani]